MPLSSDGFEIFIPEQRDGLQNIHAQLTLGEADVAQWPALKQVVGEDVLLALRAWRNRLQPYTRPISFATLQRNVGKLHRAWWITWSHAHARRVRWRIAWLSTIIVVTIIVLFIATLVVLGLVLGALYLVYLAVPVVIEVLRSLLNRSGS